MIVQHVTLQVKPEHLAEFIEIARHNAEHSVQDEPGCVRFDVIQDTDDPNRFYLYSVYRDAAATEAHFQMPHFNVYFEKSRSLLVGTPERRLGRNISPSDADWH